MQATLTDAELQSIADKVVKLMPQSKPVALPRMRLLADAASEIKQTDPGSSVSVNCIRELALSGAVPSVMVGRKRLINYDALLDYLSTVHTEPKPPVEVGKIRPIEE